MVKEWKRAITRRHGTILTWTCFLKCAHTPPTATPTAHSHTHAPTLRIQIQGKKGKSGEGGIQVVEGESSGAGVLEGAGGG